MNKINNNLPELMIPVSDIRTLDYAISYGADSVYLGGEVFNLRILGKNFTVEEIDKAVEKSHKNDVKLYLTLNSVVSEDEIAGLTEYLKKIKDIKIDAFIISDPGVAVLLRKIIPDATLHISTQANIVNHHSIEFWKEAGASRVNLARELDFQAVKKIKKNTDIEIEVFVHGALCISYSGRCMLSKYMAGRDANKGECAHSCRWKYYLMEEERPNVFYPVVQDNKGSYIYNSRDLCLIKRIDELVGAGIDCFKIEGRMKTENYVSQVTWTYNKALEHISNGEYDDKRKEYLYSQLGKISHRNYTEGFMFSDKKSLEDNENVGYINEYRFVGVSIKHDAKENGPVIYVKNQFFKDEIIDVLQPGVEPIEVIAKDIMDYETGQKINVANPNDKVILVGVGRLDKHSIFRVKAD